MSLSRLTFGVMMISVALLAQPAPPPGVPQNGDPGQGGAQQGDQPDEPGRSVARLGVLSGDVSVRRGDSGEWVAASLNAPLMAGDSISVAPGGAAEIQLDSASFARIAGDSEVRLSTLENGRYQIQLAKGLVTYRVLREGNAQSEISTPQIAVRPFRQAAIRVEIAPDGSTRVTARHGEADVYNPKGVERLHEGSTMIVRGSVDDPEFQVVSAMAPDQWDGWSDQRDAYLLHAQSPRYVSQDISGAEDLDAYGQWSYDPAYGNVWAPSVAASWAPYRNGRWVWEDFYGWTWVDYDPWGWAPFHYGSWYFRTGFGWSWFPGHRYDRVWWHPALVSFVGFGRGGIGFGFGNVGWVPLAPFERYHPWYGRGGWGLGGGSRTVINNVNIVNNYRNARFGNGVTAVSAGDFQRGNFRNQLSVDRNQLQTASVMRGGVPLSPGAENMRFNSRAASSAAPHSDLSNQRFFSRMPSASSGGTGVGQTGVGQRQSTGFAPRAEISPSWQRFGSPQAAAPARQFGAQAPERAVSPGAGYYSGRFGGSPQRSLEVAPPIVHQRETAPSYRAPAYNRGNFGAPEYRSAPAPQPAYRSAPAPSYRSAPAPAPRSGGGGGHASSGGGGGGHASGGGHR